MLHTFFGYVTYKKGVNFTLSIYRFAILRYVLFINNSIR
jgi:hypothetical protein